MCVMSVLVDGVVASECEVVRKCSLGTSGDNSTAGNITRSRKPLRCSVAVDWMTNVLSPDDQLNHLPTPRRSHDSFNDQ